MAAFSDDDLMPFGKHQGRKLEDVPASYLLWLWDEGWHARASEPLGAYIQASLAALCHECPDYILKYPSLRGGAVNTRE